MSGPLRLMTFNVQLLPIIAGVLDGTVSVPRGIAGLLPKSDIGAVARAEAVAADLLAVPVARRPHVVGLNEVFNEDGRHVLLERLSPVYPHVVESVHQGDLEEDSGLMVLSRIPFGPTPSGADREELFYSTDADDDTWASKAAVLVRVDQPVEHTTLVFTHMQASYLSEDQYRDVRSQQMQELVAWLDGLFGGDVMLWRTLIVAGDLNVRGDSGASSDEWLDAFDRPGPFADHLVDSWVEMRPPGETQDHDPGFTHRVRESGERMRLDYLARGRAVDGDELVAHQVQIAHRDTSDHFALEGLFQLRDPHCQPSTATELDGLTPTAGPGGVGQPATSTVTVVTTQIHREGSRHWIWLRRPGTYTFHTAPALAVEVFSSEDLSTPLGQVGTLSVAELPEQLQAPYRENGLEIGAHGETFTSRTPLLVAVHHRHQQPSTAPLLVLEHLGDSPATAICLPAHLDVTLPFPPGQRLGNDDLAWIRLLPSPTLVHKSRQEVVRVRTPPGRSARLDLLDPALAPVAAPASGTDEVTSGFPAVGGETFLVSVARDADDAVGHVIRWESPVTFLRLSEGIVVHVADETSADWPGADEPVLRLTVDGDPVALVELTWNDADTGEDWPGLTQAIRFQADQRGWPLRSIAFAEGLGVEIVEPDPPLGPAHGTSTHTIAPLTPDEPVPTARKLTVDVFDSVSNGTYTVSCTLAREA